MLDLHELHVFLVAAETENFSETGRVLQISQPAVSGHIQSLEQHLRTQLFDRTGRNIKLNEVGEALVPVARNLLNQARLVEEFMAFQRGQLSGHLAVGCSTAAGKYVLPRIMSRFLNIHPNVRILCDVGRRGQALDRLCAGEIDVAVTSLRIPRRAIEYKHFADDRLVLIAQTIHPWAASKQITADQLTEFPLILREPGSGTSITLNRGLSQFDMSIEMLDARLVLGNTEAIVRAVVEGIGPAFVSKVAVEDLLKQGLLVEIDVKGLDLVQNLYMARHTDFNAPEIQTAFWDFTFAPENQALRQLLTP